MFHQVNANIHISRDYQHSSRSFADSRRKRFYDRVFRSFDNTAGQWELIGKPGFVNNGTELQVCFLIPFLFAHFSYNQILPFGYIFVEDPHYRRWRQIWIIHYPLKSIHTRFFIRFYQCLHIHVFIPNVRDVIAS